MRFGDAMRSLLVMLCTLLMMPVLADSQPADDSWRRSDLEWQVDNDQLKPLTVGEQEFMTLQLPAMTNKVKGTVVLLPDASQLPVSPRYIQTLRQRLVDYGWNTIALLPPVRPMQDPSEQQQQDYQQQLMALALAATTAARESKGRFIMMAQGNNAALLTQLYADKKLPEPDSLILLSAYHPVAADNKRLPQWIAQLIIPTLDMKQVQDSSAIQHNWQARRQWANKERKLLYRQRDLPGDMQSPLWQEHVVKEVYGWLTYQGY